jgi:hypothetical protein
VTNIIIMWKGNTLALLALAMVASIGQVKSFSSTLHVTRWSNPSSALCESFDNEDDYEQPKKKGFFANFFQELDAFVDDATSRRLGNGAQFYGKRKSSFYGQEDSNKKRDRVSPCLVDGAEYVSLPVLRCNNFAMHYRMFSTLLVSLANSHRC